MFENLMNQHFPQIMKGFKKPQIQDVQRTVNKTNVKKRKKRVNSLYIIIGEITNKIKAKQTIIGREKIEKRDTKNKQKKQKIKKKRSLSNHNNYIKNNLSKNTRLFRHIIPKL